MIEIKIYNKYFTLYKRFNKVKIKTAKAYAIKISKEYNAEWSYVYV